MLEFPEVYCLAAQCGELLTGKKVKAVMPPSKPHKFCWYNGEPQDYDSALKDCSIESATSFGGYMELGFSGGHKLCIQDGVNLRLVNGDNIPKAYQLLIQLTDGSALVFTVAMYGGIMLHEGDMDNPYYRRSKTAPKPFTSEFEEEFFSLIASCKPNLSAKAFLATEQRFPGIGNGVLQDILFQAGINPRRKLNTMEDNQRRQLFKALNTVLKEMIDGGGRDTEKDLLGNSGCYATRLSKLTVNYPCLNCGGPIVKEAYLGGSVYYCPTCQP